MGKSTILGGLQELLPKETAFAYFDAWRYEGESLRRQFLLDVTGQLETTHLRGFTVKKDLQELETDRQTIEEGFSLSLPRLLRALAVGALFAAIALVASQLGAFDSFINESDFGKRLLPALAAGTLTVLASLLSQGLAITQTVVTRRALQEPGQFSTKFAEMLKALKGDRLVVAIDNLDRCAPDKAVEMLSTIKTYLEPTVEVDRRPRSPAQETAKREIIFILAVDDAALRRHLVAQESERSRDPDEAATRRYVDEYLAKFFSARLPIRDILPDDMRGYVEEHLQPLINARNLESQRTQLAELVSSGLRRNPRQVKQFVNDLETRLRLLEERERPSSEGKAGINPPVSGEVLMVAKLALIESVWPAAFEKLQQEHRRLAEWHAEAEEANEVWVDERQKRESDPSVGQTFAAFLNASRAIRSKNLRALLRLKQSPAEVELPGFIEFREAVISRDRAAVERVLADASADEQRGYADQLAPILKEEIGQDYVRGAIGAVDAAVSVDRLRSLADARKTTMRAAINDPRIRSELATLDPRAVLQAGRDLHANERRMLLDPFVSRFVDEEQDEPSRKSAAEGLAQFTEELSSGQRQRISKALEGELVSHFDVYRALAEADAELLPTGVARAAMEALAAPDDEGNRTLLGRDDSFTIAKIALAHEAIPDLDDLAIEHVIQSLDAAQVDASKLAKTLERAQELLSALQSAPEESWTRLATHVQERWRNYPPQQWPAGLALLEHILPLASESTPASVAGSVASLIFSDPGQGLELLTGLEKIPDDFVEPFIGHLASLVGTQPSHRDRAAEALLEIGGDVAGERLAQAIVQAVQQGDFDGAAGLLETYRELLRPHGSEIGEHVLIRARELVTPGGAVPFIVLARVVPITSREQSDAIGNFLVERLTRGDAQVADAVRSLPSDQESRRVLRTVLRAAVAMLSGTPQIEPPHFPVLEIACEGFQQLTKAETRTLIDGLGAWLRAQPDQRVPLAYQARKLRGLQADFAKDLVDALITAEEHEGDQSARIELLVTAHQIRGARNTRAARAVDKRLTALKQGNETDQAVAEQVDEALLG